MDADRLRRSLVRFLVSHGAVRSDRVRDAFLAVPRELFVPEVLSAHGLRAVYSDEALAVKRDEHGVPISSSSQPAIMAEMLEHLHLELGMKVLEIGTGTGYNAALLKHIVGTGKVVTVDLESDLAAGAQDRLSRLGLDVEVVVGDGARGWPPEAPYDRIIATASVSRIPQDWIAQLLVGGRLVTPLRPARECSWPQVVVEFERSAQGLTSGALIPGGFMSLRTSAGQPAPEAPRTPSPRAFGDDEEPRIIRLFPEPPRYAFDVFVAFSVAPHLLVENDGRSGRSRLAISADGSFAFAAGKKNDYSWIEGRGGGEAIEILAGVHREWVEWGYPALDDLVIDVSTTGDMVISSSAGQPGS